MNGSELRFWLAVGLVSIASIAIFKVIGAQSWTPDGLKRLAGFL